MRRYLHFLPLFVVPTVAHAADYKVDLIAQPEQHSRMVMGQEAVDSVQPPTVVRIVETGDWTKGRGWFQIGTLNGGTEPFNFGPENITLVLPDGTREPVARYEQLVKEEKGRQDRRAFGLLLGAMGRGMQASQAGAVNGTVYSSTGRPVASYSGTDGGAQAQAQAHANAETAAQASALRHRDAEGMAALGDILRTTTIDPGKVFGGRVMFAFPKAWRKDGDYPVDVEVVAGGAVHRFKATISRK